MGSVRGSVGSRQKNSGRRGRREPLCTQIPSVPCTLARSFHSVVMSLGRSLLSPAFQSTLLGQLGGSGCFPLLLARRAYAQSLRQGCLGTRPRGVRGRQVSGGGGAVSAPVCPSIHESERSLGPGNSEGSSQQDGLSRPHLNLHLVPLEVISAASELAAECGPEPTRLQARSPPLPPTCPRPGPDGVSRPQPLVMTSGVHRGPVGRPSEASLYEMKLLSPGRSNSWLRWHSTRGTGWGLSPELLTLQVLTSEASLRAGRVERSGHLRGLFLRAET